MLDTYFFVPGNKPTFLRKIQTLEVDYFIIDLEDTVTNSEWTESIANIKEYTEISKHYIRPNLYENGQFSLALLRELISNNARQFVFPKVNTFAQIDAIYKLEGIEKSIILVETPQMLQNLRSVLEVYPIEGIGFGSNDFAMYTGIRDKAKYMNHFRILLKMLGLEFNVKLIDTASMNLYSEPEFIDECINAFDLGFDGKFLIHPNQIKMLHRTPFYNEAEIEWAQEVWSYLASNPGVEITAHNINNQVLEKAHVSKLEKIRKYLEFKNQIK